MATTIAVSDDLRRELMRLKLEEGSRSVDELLRNLLVDHRKMKFLEASAMFRARMREQGIRLEDLVA